MLASINKSGMGYKAQFDRPLAHSVDEVWAVITENDKLKKWMHNLEVVDLRENGIIKFNMNDGTGASFDIRITDFEELAVLEFEWDENSVRFELHPQSGGCLLVLRESISTLTDHTAKDLAGWHVCLDVLSALLDGEQMEFPMDEWEIWHNKYIEEINRLRN